jgi:hypothetical protein
VSVKEKMLDLIGLAPMTNRDRLLEELGGMDGERLYQALADNRSTRLIDDAMCAACHRMHDGKCPKPDDSECALTIGAWLDMAWDGTPILLEVAQ